MKKEELIEKYPDLVKKIAIEFCHKVILLGDKEEESLWEEYLAENKFEPEFLVHCIRINEKQLWLSPSLKEFLYLEGFDVISYELGKELGEITAVSYDKVWYNIGNEVSYNLKEYIIVKFDGEIVIIKRKDDENCIYVHISNIGKI
jgi:hypothetical protein